MIVSITIEMRAENTQKAEQRCQTGTKRVGKTIKKCFVKGKLEKEVNPIDEIIMKCLNIHETLTKSNKMLSQFSLELQKITDHMDRIRITRYDANVTTMSLEDDAHTLLDHRRLFDKFLDYSEIEDEEADPVLPLNSHEQFGTKNKERDSFHFDLLDFEVKSKEEPDRGQLLP